MKTPKKPRGNPDILAAGLKTRFQAGQPSANPSGRPKTRPITDRHKICAETPLPAWWLRKLNRQYHLALASGCTWADAHVAMEWVRSFNDLSFAKEIGDRLEGKALQALRIAGEDGGPIAMRGVGEEAREELEDRILAGADRIRAYRAQQRCRAS